MAVNDLTFNQLAGTLTAIVNQATGKSNLTPTNTSEFVSVAQVGLKTGYDPLATAISQVLGRTIFSMRPYSRKFKGLEVNEQKWGAITRKVVAIDKPFEADDRLALTDGASVDQYRVNKPQALQTNFYGANVYQKSLTIYRDQLDTAFQSPDDFQRFLGMVVQNASDQIEQAHESTARATIANFVGGKKANDAANVIHLLAEYNAQSGQELDAQTIYQDANFASFARWMYSRIATIGGMMAERSTKFHQNLTNTDIMRHTPVDEQRVFLYQPTLNQINSQVLSTTYNDNYLKIAKTEGVNFWQSINSPASISVTPMGLNADGTVSATAAQTVNNLFGVIADREALGYTTMSTWAANTPFNARGGYYNMFWHFTERYWNDFTENGVILLLD